MKLDLDQSVLNELRDILPDTSCKNIDELVNMIIQNFISQYRHKNQEEKTDSKEILESRLKNLGYL